MTVKSHLSQTDLRNAVYECFPWQPASSTNPTTNFYVPLVWGDTVLFHAALQLSAMRFQKARMHNESINIKHISGECIRLLRGRVESFGSTTGVSDETISAVATLAAIEVRYPPSKSMIGQSSNFVARER